jgi:heparanase
MVLVWKPLVKHATHVALFSGAVVMQARTNANVYLAPANMKQIGTVDERYQSYNIEMLEVTGGKFWKPYKDIRSSQEKALGVTAAASGGSDAPAGMSADLYEY